MEDQMAPLATVLMSREEARVAIDSVTRKASEIGDLVVGLHDREGWRALGYASFHECMQKELGISRPRAYQLLEGARVNAILLSPGKTTPALPAPIKESHARELAPLKHDPEAVRRVAGEVLARTNGKPKASDFRASVIRAVPKPGQKAPTITVTKPAQPSPASVINTLLVKIGTLDVTEIVERLRKEQRTPEEARRVAAWFAVLADQL